MIDELVRRLAGRLVERGQRLALAESCTGGLLAERVTAGAGASAFFAGGVVSYSNEAKHRLLGVPVELLATHGAVSEPVARAMAEGAMRAIGAEAGIAITGIAGPDGGTPEKPVGTVWIAASAGKRTLARIYRFDGDRQAIRLASAEAALQLVGEVLEDGR